MVAHGSVTSHWALASLHHALLPLAVYLVIVAVGTIVMRALHGPLEPEEAKNLTVVDKFKREPILVLQAAYNAAQVASCDL